MGIDASDLARFSPWAQKQITEKLMKQEQEKAARKTPHQPDNPIASHQVEAKAGKYHNTPTERITEDGNVIKFQSQKEARRYDELMLMRKAGTIRDLKLQPQFTLQESYVTPDGNRIRAIIYKADFSYEEQITTHFVESRTNYHYDDTSWQFVVEDVKSKATKTRVYGMKKKLLREKFGIDIVEVE